MGVHLAVGQHAEFLELLGVEQVGLVDDEDGEPATFVFLGGEQVHGLRDQRGLVEPGDTAQVSAYSLTCMASYDLMCRSVSAS